MSSTACDDQHTSEPSDDLDKQCREIRAKAKDVCVWTLTRSIMGGSVACINAYWHYSPEYRVCPFCAKPIRVVK